MCDDTNVGPGKQYGSIVEAEEAKYGKYSSQIADVPLVEKSPYANLPVQNGPKPFNIKG